jgi:hypothetical protein
MRKVKSLEKAPSLPEGSMNPVDHLPVWPYLSHDQKRFLNYYPMFRSKVETCKALGFLTEKGEINARWCEIQEQNQAGFKEAVRIRELQPAKHLPGWLEELDMRATFELEKCIFSFTAEPKSKMDAIKELNRMRPKPDSVMRAATGGNRARLSQRGMEQEVNEEALTFD